jgi:hypothetical protein
LNFLQFWIYLVARLFRIWCFEFRIWLSGFVSNFGFRASDLLLHFQPQDIVGCHGTVKAFER